MSMKKYLESIHCPQYQPGPYGVRLKYELQKEFFGKKQKLSVFPVFSYFAALFFFTLFILMALKPEFAQRVQLVFNPAPDFDLQMQGVNIEPRRSKVLVSGGMVIGSDDLSNLDSQKSYIIRRVNASDNGEMFYVNEVEQKPSIAY